MLVLVILLSTIVSAQCPEGQDCPEQVQYSYEQFQSDFADNPVEVAQDYPDEYMQHIKRNPGAVKEHPEAYEAVIGRGEVRYINQNKEAFRSYTETKEVAFTSIKGDFLSYDAATGRFETKGAGGEAKVSFTLDSLESFADSYELAKDGQLHYKMRHGTEGSFEGRMELKQNEDRNWETVLTDGKISHNGFIVELHGENKAVLGDVYIELEVVSSPIPVPGGVLLEGRALVQDAKSIVLLEGKVKDKQGATFEVTQNTIIGPSCKEKFGWVLIKSCIQHIEGNLAISSAFGNKIKVEAPDGAYKNIVVKKMDDELPRARVGDLDYSVDALGLVYRQDGPMLARSPISDQRKIQEVLSSPDYDSALEKAQEMTAGKTSSVELSLTKGDGTVAKITFSALPPLAQGSLYGMKSNLAHVFEQNGILYPWMVYGGEPTVTAQGDIQMDLLQEITRLRKAGRLEEANLMASPFDEFRYRHITFFMEKGKFSREAWQLMLAKTPGLSDEENLNKRMGFLSLSDSPLAREIQLELLESEGTISEDDALFLLRATDQHPEIQNRIFEQIRDITTLGNLLGAAATEELQRKMIQGADEITDPGWALRSVESDELKMLILDRVEVINSPSQALKSAESDELRRLILQKTQLLEHPLEDLPYYEPPNELIDYLSELEKLSPELQRIAMQNTDFRKGVFAGRYKGEAMRRVLAFHKDKPEQMRGLLEELPVHEDLGFNPRLFSEVYFDDSFQEQTQDLDFENRYSVAYGIQEFLERSGIPPNKENLQQIVAVVVRHRDAFGQENLADEETTLISITHEERMFENGVWERIARSAGVKEVISFKGAAEKSNILESIAESKGELLIAFNGHGGQRHLGLSPKAGSFEKSEELLRPDSLSFREVGEALYARMLSGEKLTSTRVVIDACLSGTFKDWLHDYLEGLGVDRTEFPRVVAVTNREEVSYGTLFSGALEKAREKKTEGGKTAPLKGEDIYKTQSDPKVFLIQDLSVTMSLSDDEKLPSPESVRPIGIGSSYGEGRALPPKKPSKKASGEDSKPNVPLPLTVIEVASSEQEMMRRLDAVG